eukprot:gene7217-60367_t
MLLSRFLPASRFAVRVDLPLPSAAERAAILTLYARHLPPAALRGVAGYGAPIIVPMRCEGMSGRDLRAVAAAAERRWAYADAAATIADAMSKQRAQAEASASRADPAAAAAAERR